MLNSYTFTLISSQIYTGPYRPRDTVASVADIWDHVRVSTFVAVSLLNYENVPVIGKVLEKEENLVKIHYWKGSWNKKWIPWEINGKPWTDDLPKDCVYLAAFELDKESKLQRDTKRKMREFIKNKNK